MYSKISVYVICFTTAYYLQGLKQQIYLGVIWQFIYCKRSVNVKKMLLYLNRHRKTELLMWLVHVCKLINSLTMHYTYIQVCGNCVNTYNNTSNLELCVAMSGNNNAFVRNGFQMQNLSVKLSGLWWTCPEVQLS